MKIQISQSKTFASFLFASLLLGVSSPHAISDELPGLVAPAPSPVAPAAPVAPVAPAPVTPTAPVALSPGAVTSAAPAQPTTTAPAAAPVATGQYGSSAALEYVPQIPTIQQSVTGVSSTQAPSSISGATFNFVSASPVVYSTPVVAPITTGAGVSVTFAPVPTLSAANGSSGATSSTNSSSDSGSTGQVSISMAAASSSSGQAQPLEDSTLVIRAKDEVKISVAGLKPNSKVSLYAFSEPTFIGSVMTDSSGNYSGALAAPAELPDGNHTIQMGVYLADGSIAAISLPVLIKRETQKSGFKLSFSNGISKVSKAQIKTLNRSIADLSESKVIEIDVLGLLPKGAVKSADKKIALARANQVAKFLKKLEVRGKVVVSTKKSIGKVNNSNRVEVAITSSKD